MAFGAGRVAGTEGGFSYTNAFVAVCDDAVAGMLLGYKLPDRCDTERLDDVPPVVRPLVELESLAPGAWYVNAVATDSMYRGQGIGRKLMEWAEQLAEESGAAGLSLIVAEENDSALRLYEKLGYQVVERREIVQYPGCSHAGDWILMTKEVGPVGGGGV